MTTHDDCGGANRSQRSLLAVVALTVVLLAAACGSSSPSATTPTTVARHRTTTTTPGPQPPSQPAAPTTTGPDGLVELAGVERALAPAADTAAAAPIVRAVGSELFLPAAKDSNSGIDGNLVFSPASLAIALAMLRAGAQSESAKQIDTFLHVPAGVDLSAAMNGLDAKLTSLSGNLMNAEGNSGPVALWSANSLWGQQGTTWATPFLRTLATDFGTGMRDVDYIRDPDGARREINQWVSYETRGKIPELIPAGEFGPTNVLTLVNALYFKAPWYVAFDKESQPQPFHRLDGSTVQTAMMSDSSAITHASGAGWTAIRLPYAGQKLALTLIVPDAGKFASVRAQMVHGLLDQVQDAHYATDGGQLQVPLFDLRSMLLLNDELEALGVTAPFAGGDDFDPMSSQLAGRIQVSEVRQQATITVDEKGTEAAAATAVELTNLGLAMPRHPFDFDVDRPFLFVLGDVATGTPLFMGQVTDPSVKG